MLLCLLSLSLSLSLQHLVDRVSGFMHVFTLYGSVRPFGCSIMMGAYGTDGPQLFLADPSGVSWVSGCGQGMGLL